MARLFVPPTSFLISIPLLMESLIELILSTIYLVSTKDGAVVFIVVCVRLRSDLLRMKANETDRQHCRWHIPSSISSVSSTMPSKINLVHLRGASYPEEESYATSSLCCSWVWGCGCSINRIAWLRKLKAGSAWESVRRGRKEELQGSGMLWEFLQSCYCELVLW